MIGTGLALQASPLKWAMSAAPEAWTWKRLKFVADINTESLPDDTAPLYTFRYIDISSIDAHGNIADLPSLAFGSAPTRARRVVKSGDILISTVRTYLKAIGRAPAPCDDIIASTGFAVVTPGADVVGDFLYWWCRSKPFVDEVAARSVGVGYPAINSSDIGDIAVPLPPIETQTRTAEYLNSIALDKRRILDALERESRFQREEHESAIVSATLGQITVP